MQKHTLGEVGNWSVIWRQVVSGIFVLLKSVNWFSSYSRTYWDTFFETQCSLICHLTGVFLLDVMSRTTSYLGHRCPWCIIVPLVICGFDSSSPCCTVFLSSRELTSITIASCYLLEIIWWQRDVSFCCLLLIKSTWLWSCSFVLFYVIAATHISAPWLCCSILHMCILRLGLSVTLYRICIFSYLF